MSVPTSSETGSVRAGWMPHAAVYSASFPIGIAMPPAPWSPRPRIRSLSVTTIRRTSSYGRVAQDLRDAVDVLGRDPDAARPPQDVAVFLAGPPDGRRVDDRQELLDVLGQDPVEERRVAILQGSQADVLLEVVVLAPEVLDLEVDLLLDRQDAIRQQAAEAEDVALLRREGEVLGEETAGQERRARDVDRRRQARGDPIEGRRQGAHRRQR